MYHLEHSGFLRADLTAYHVTTVVFFMSSDLLYLVKISSW